MPTPSSKPFMQLPPFFSSSAPPQNPPRAREERESMRALTRAARHTLGPPWPRASALRASVAEAQRHAEFDASQHVLVVRRMAHAAAEAPCGIVPKWRGDHVRLVV